MRALPPYSKSTSNSSDLGVSIIEQSSTPPIDKPVEHESVQRLSLGHALPRNNGDHTGTSAGLGVLFGAVTRLAQAGAVAVVAGCSSMPSGAPFVTPPVATRHIGNVPITLAPSRASMAEKFAHYQAIVHAAGGVWPANERHVLALRGADLETGKIRETVASRTMSDTIVVLWKDASGQPQVRELVGSTHPGQASVEGNWRDVDRDGTNDVGMVKEGRFAAIPNGEFLGEWSYQVLNLNRADGLAGVRDTDHDGRHSSEEWADSSHRGDRLHEVLFHRGFQDGSVASIGCFNVKDFPAFITALGGKSARFHTTVVNAYRAEPTG